MALLEYVYMFKEYELGFGFQILIESISEIFGKIYFNISIYNMHFLSKLQTRERCRELWEDHAGKGGDAGTVCGIHAVLGLGLCSHFPV